MYLHFQNKYHGFQIYGWEKLLLGTWSHLYLYIGSCCFAFWIFEMFDNFLLVVIFHYYEYHWKTKLFLTLSREKYFISRRFPWPMNQKSQYLFFIRKHILIIFFKLLYFFCEAFHIHIRYWSLLLFPNYHWWVTCYNVDHIINDILIKL